MENFEHVMRLEEMARHRMSRRAGGAGDVAGEEQAGLDTGRKQGHYLRDLIISEATDWQVLTLHLAVHMQQLQSAISAGSADAGQVRVLRVERAGGGGAKGYGRREYQAPGSGFRFVGGTHGLGRFWLDD